jgi:hypothetical protein
MAPPMNRPRAARALSDLLKPALADALKAQGFAAADILGRWPEIAGPRLAAASLPVRVLFPPRPKAAPPDQPPPPATLVLKVESAYALEVEMQAAEIMERINRVFGWRCIGRLRLRQGPVAHTGNRKAAPPAALGPDDKARLGRRLSSIEDDGLKASLERLGTAVLARRAVTRA